ncbi:MAG: hypothetical protein WBH01_05865 [Dehalococcoidia bacterium]
MTKRGEYHEKLEQWEAEGYDVSEFKQKWFPEGEGTGKGRAWMPRAAGILDLVGGVYGLIWSILVLIGSGIFVGSWYRMTSGPVIVLSTIAIAGGICAVRSKTWRLSLTGAICVLAGGLLSAGASLGLLLGILAVTFTILGKSRFK